MIPIASDALVVLTKLKNEDTGQTIDNATVSGKLYTILANDPDVELTSFTFTAKGSGRYHGIIPSSVTEDLINGANYLIVVTAIDGINQSVFHEVDVATYQT